MTIFLCINISFINQLSLGVLVILSDNTVKIISKSVDICEYFYKLSSGIAQMTHFLHIFP